MKQKKFWLKLFVTAIVLHIVLIMLSIIEVVIYSYVIAPGKKEAFYTEHASISAPWVSAVFGSLLMFFLVRSFNKRFSQQQLTYVTGLLALHLIFTIVLFFAGGYPLKDFALPFVLVNLPKIIAALVAYFLYKDEKKPVSKKPIFYNES